MGSILSKLTSGSQKHQNTRTTYEILEKIEENILITENTLEKSQIKCRNTVQNLLNLTLIAYFASCVLVYLYFVPDTWFKLILYISPLLIVYPLTAWSIRKCILMYFNMKLTNLSNKIRVLKAEKTAVLNEVMENENYKTARCILERFGYDDKIGEFEENYDKEHMLSSSEVVVSRCKSAVDSNISVRSRDISSNSLIRRCTSANISQHDNRNINRNQSFSSTCCLSKRSGKNLSTLDQRVPMSMENITVTKEPVTLSVTAAASSMSVRNVTAPANTNTSTTNHKNQIGPIQQEIQSPIHQPIQQSPIQEIQQSPIIEQSINHQPIQQSINQPIIQQSPIQQSNFVPLLPRPILADHRRTVLDRLVDFIADDGASKRYAMICNRCHSHNGMALKEEFEYLAFRCAFCGSFNPARQKRPLPPDLQNFMTNIEDRNND